MGEHTLVQLMALGCFILEIIFPNMTRPWLSWTVLLMIIAAFILPHKVMQAALTVWIYSKGLKTWVET